MKNSLNILVAVVLCGILAQGCMQPKVDHAKEWAKIDSMANAKLMTLRDQQKMMCMTNIMSTARSRADSMLVAAIKKAKATGSKPQPKPVATTPVKPSEPSISNRPGTTNNPAQQPTISNRPGTTNNPAEKPTISNRPGATKTPADTTKPKN